MNGCFSCVPGSARDATAPRLRLASCPWQQRDAVAVRIRSGDFAQRGRASRQLRPRQSLGRRDEKGIIEMWRPLPNAVFRSQAPLANGGYPIRSRYQTAFFGVEPRWQTGDIRSAAVTKRPRQTVHIRSATVTKRRFWSRASVGKRGIFEFQPSPNGVFGVEPQLANGVYPICGR
jgi:hypothetical protein